MRPYRAQFVTACQQILALGVVLAVLTPAAAVISLDVVAHPPSDSSVSSAGSADAASGGAPREGAALAASMAAPRLVPTKSVAADVTDYALTPGAGARSLARSVLQAGPRRVVSDRIAVDDFGTVGFTWAPGQRVPDTGASFEVRSLRDGSWSAWTEVEYHDDHGPDATSQEAGGARPGTDAIIVGDVDQVQVRGDVKVGLPNDLRVSVITPGRAAGSEIEAPAIRTARPGGAPAAETPVATKSAGTGEKPGLALRAAAYTPAPSIFSRGQWGADESMRDGSPKYYEVHAGFVHHTVTQNSYSRSDVPGILRSIYAYHTRSRGWSDIGYNFLVDRFGQIWEGRAGGVNRPVVGAHTLGYNEYSFAMSAMGNFETKQPTSAMVGAYGSLFAWKLSLHGVSAASTSQKVGSKTFQAINGHRDAGSTACPGKNLYAKLPTIRSAAAAAQVGWSGRERESNLAGGPQPDLVVRRTSDKRGIILPIEGGANPQLGKPIDTGVSFADAKVLLNVGDWDRDGFGDVAVRKSDGALYLLRGNGTGALGAPQLLGAGFATVRLLTSVGDMTGDGWPDLMGQPKGLPMQIYPGRGLSGIAGSYTAYSRLKGGRMMGVGLMDRDGAPDTVIKRKGRLTIYPGNGPGGLRSYPKTLKRSVKKMNWLVGVSDIDGRGHADLIVRLKGTGELRYLRGRGKSFRSGSSLGSASGYDKVGG